MNKCKLGDLFYIKQGYAFQSKKYVSKSPYVLCTLGNFSDSNNFKFNPEKATYYPDDFSHEFILQENDLIIPLTEQVIGLFGNTAFVPKTNNFQFVLNQRVGKIIPYDGKVDKVFLHYLLSTQSVRDQIEATASGTKQRNTSPDKIYDVTVWVPCIEVQQAIGNCLYQLEQKYNTNTDICSGMEAMAKTLYDYWFVQFDFPDENGRPYCASGGEMVWNEQLKREIPEGWSVTTIGRIANNFDSQRIPLSQNQRENIQGTIPYYGATGIMDYINDYIFDGQYVLIAEDGSVMDDSGYPIVQMIWDKTWVNNHAHVLQGHDYYSNEILYFILKGIPVVKIMTGSIQKKINQDNLNNYLIPSIPQKILGQFYLLVKDIFEQIHQLELESKELLKLRDWLLPMLMNGQARVE